VSSRRSVGWACEAAGVGAWGRAFQVWGSWFSGRHLRRCRWSVDGSDEHSVSELTTRPRMGEDCWSRGLQSALLLRVLRWGVSHRWLLPGLMDSDSLRQQLCTIGLYTHCLGLQRGSSVDGLGRSSSCPRRWRRMPLGCTGPPPLLALLAPELDGLFTAEFLAVLEQRHRLIRQQFAAGHLQSLAPAIPVGRSEVEHAAAVAEPALFWREGRPPAGPSGLAPGAGHAPSGAQPFRRTMSSVQP